MAGQVPFRPQGLAFLATVFLPSPFPEPVRRFFLTLFLLAALIVLGAGAAGLWWVNQPLKLPAPSVDLSVEPGTTPRGIAQAVADAGVDVPPQLLYLWFRFSGQDRQMRAGSYELDLGITPRLLLSILVRGEEATRSLVLVEGWNFRQVRAALAKAEQLKPETAGRSDEELMANETQALLMHTPDGRAFNASNLGISDAALAQLRTRFRAGEPSYSLKNP